VNNDNKFAKNDVGIFRNGSLFAHAHPARKLTDRLDISARKIGSAIFNNPGLKKYFSYLNTNFTEFAGA
jgi:hypothetical protein